MSSQPAAPQVGERRWWSSPTAQPNGAPVPTTPHTRYPRSHAPGGGRSGGRPTKRKRTPSQVSVILVGASGIEPPTPTVSTQRGPLRGVSDRFLSAEFRYQPSRRVPHRFAQVDRMVDRIAGHQMAPMGYMAYRCAAKARLPRGPSSLAPDLVRSRSVAWEPAMGEAEPVPRRLRARARPTPLPSRALVVGRGDVEARHRSGDNDSSTTRSSAAQATIPKDASVCASDGLLIVPKEMADLRVVGREHADGRDLGGRDVLHRSTPTSPSLSRAHLGERGTP